MVNCRHLDARSVGACTENCFYSGITEGDGEEAGDAEEAGDELLALTATSPPNTDGYLMK